MQGAICIRKRKRTSALACFGILITAYIVLYKKIRVGNGIHRSSDHVSVLDKLIGKDVIMKQETIPKIIHQIWSDEVLPEEFVKHVQSVVKYNQYPEWDYFFWTLDVGLEFIRQYYPKLETIYKRAAKITKSEILRTVLIYHYGGVYFDLDVVAMRPLDRFVENHECALVGPIPVYFVAYDQKIDERNLNSAIYLCKAHHPFFKLHIQQTENLSESCKVTNQTCPPPDFPFPLLVELTDKGDNDSVPEIVNYELFDSKYDSTITGLLKLKCSGKSYASLERAKQQICDDWRRCGEENRVVSESAYTFHTWYHANARPYTIDRKNVIWNIVPHVKIYNSLLRGHFEPLMQN